MEIFFTIIEMYPLNNSYKSDFLITLIRNPYNYCIYIS